MHSYTKVAILNKSERTAEHYFIREIDGRKMLFIWDLGIYERLIVWLGVPIILAVMFLVSFLGRLAVLRSWEKNRIRK